MTDKHRERVAEIVRDIFGDDCEGSKGRAAAERIHALYSREGAEPVAWCPMRKEEYPDGAYYRVGPDPDVGRIMAYRTREQAESHMDDPSIEGAEDAEEVLVPLYTAPPESRLRAEVERLKRENAELIVALPNEATVDEVLRLRKALEDALTWEGRLNKAEQLGMQGHSGVREALTIKGAIAKEMREARNILSDTQEEG